MLQKPKIKYHETYTKYMTRDNYNSGLLTQYNTAIFNFDVFLYIYQEL